MATPIPKNRVERTSAEVEAATSGTLVSGDPGRTHVGITSDSREVTPGSIFVALRGESFDGHAFAADAARAGATLVVCERGHAVPGADVVEVDDTLAAWGAIARDHLLRWRSSTAGRVVAITGSAGKTTTKSLLAALLGEIAETHATAGNLNNRIGVPATIFGLEPRHRFSVLEVGTNLPGEIATLAAIASPDAAIITNIGLAHAERLGGTRAGVGREKGALFEALSEAGCAVVNADDDEVERQLSRSRARHIVRFGRAPSSDYRLVDRRGSKSFVLLPMDRRHPGGSKAGSGASPIALDLPIAGEAAAIDFLAALAAAEFIAQRPLSSEELTHALENLSPAPGRATLHALAEDITLIDDSYNANPSSMAAAIDLAVELAQTGNRRILAVLGEMRELGAAAGDAHRALGDDLGRAGVHLVIGCGGAIDLTLERAAVAGVDVVHASGASDAATLACARVQPGDVVLVKGSRGVRTERIVEALLSLLAPAHAPGRDEARPTSGRTPT